MTARTKKTSRHRQVNRRTAAEIARDGNAEFIPGTTVAAHIGVSPRTVLNLTESGKIKAALKFGRTYRYRLEDVLAALAVK